MKLAIIGLAALTVTATLGSGAEARDRPFSTSKMTVRPVIDPLDSGSTTGGGGQFSKVQIERYRCEVAAGSAYGTPAGAMDISCNDRQPYRQDFNPDNEIAIVVNPKVPDAPAGRLQRLLLPVQQLHRSAAGARPDRLLHLVRRRRHLGRRADPDADRQRRR